MSSKTSQRRTKAAVAEPSAATPAAVTIAPEPVVAPVPEAKAPAPAADVKEAKPRGSKRKSPEAAESKDATTSAPATKKAKKPKAEAAAPKPEDNLAAGATTSSSSGKSKKKKASAKAESAAKVETSIKVKAEPAEASATATDGAASGAPAEGEASSPVDDKPSVSRYLRTLFKTLYPESTISKEAVLEVQRLIYQFGLQFLVNVKRHLESARKTTLMIHDMPICLERVLNGSSSTLYSELSSAMQVAHTQYVSSYPEDKTKDTSVESVVTAVDVRRKQMWAARAGLSIPPTRVKEFAKQYLPNFRFAQPSITGLTAFLERLAGLLFKISFEQAQELNRKRISFADVDAAVNRTSNNLQWLLQAPVMPIV